MQDLEKFKNEMNLSGKNVYVGHRYGPVLDDSGWDNTKEYEPLTIIQYQGDSYVSRTWVPKDVDILNKDYWYSIGVYNAQVASYRQRVDEVESDLNNYKNGLDTVTSEIENAKILNGVKEFDTIDERLNKSLVSLNYEMFRNSGLTDDEIIQKTHEVANFLNIPVINLSGEYTLNQPLDIPILTSVNWGKTVFHFKESNYSATLPYFRFVEEKPKVELSLTVFESIREKINKGYTDISEFYDYENSFVLIQDKNTVKMKRQGNASPSFYNEDFFYIGKGGKLVGDITTKFDEITNIIIKPSSAATYVKGGVFDFDNGKTSLTSVFSPFRVEKSNMTFEGITTKMADGVTDTESANYLSGLFYAENVCNLTFNNVKLVPRNTSGSYSSYGIGGQHVFNLTFDNVIGEGENASWGVTGFNLVKDFKVLNSYLNRLDVHYMVWNLTVLNSKISDKGIRITGGGDLYIDNTTVENTMAYVDFRTDYGAFWNGRITIKNGKLKPKDLNQKIRLLFFQPASNHDYNIDLTFGDKITITDFEFDLSDYVHPSQPIILDLTDGNFADNVIKFPENIHLKNVLIKGNESRGITIANFIRANQFKLNKKGSVTNYHIKTNALIELDNITMSRENNQLVQRYDTSIRTGNNTYINPYSLYPKFIIKNMNGVTINAEGAPSEFNIGNSLIHYLSFSDTNKAYLTIKDSDVQLIKNGSTKSVIKLYSTLLSNIRNVKILPPIIDDVIDYSAFNEYNELFNSGVIAAENIKGSNFGNLVERRLSVESEVLHEIKEKLNFSVESY